MKRISLSIFAIVLLVLLASAEAYARGGRGGGSHGRGFHGHHGQFRSHHGHFHRGHFAHPRTRVFVGIGAPIVFGSWWYSTPPAYYAYPPIETAPLAYIEQGDVEPSSTQQPQSWWYYCPDSQTYFPYVDKCASVWQQVAPVPPSSP
jgi:hypothetical protein